MTEKLLTGTLNLTTNRQTKWMIIPDRFVSSRLSLGIGVPIFNPKIVGYDMPNKWQNNVATTLAF